MSPENRTPDNNPSRKLITEVPGFPSHAAETGTVEQVDQSVDVVELTPAQKQEAYIATLADRYDFDPIEERISILTLKRSPDSTHKEPWPDPGWELASYGRDEKRNVQVGVFRKYLHPDDKEPSQKLVELNTAFEFSAEAAEIARAKSPKVELADRAMKITGPANPNVIVPFHDPSSNAISGEELRALREEVNRTPGAEVSEVVTDKIDSLSLPRDRADVLQYRNLSREQFRAHKEGDFLRSKDLKEAAFALKQKMSPAAVAAIYN